MATAAEDTIEEKANWHWRNSMRPVRFFNLDARAALPFALLLVYARPISLGLTILTTLVFHFLERKGLTFPAALRSLRLWFIGNYRPGWPVIYRRSMTDNG